LKAILRELRVSPERRGETSELHMVSSASA